MVRAGSKPPSSRPPRQTGASSRPRARTVGGATARAAQIAGPSATRWFGRFEGTANSRRARRVAVLVGIGAMLFVFLGSTVVAWVHQRNQIADLRAQVASQTQSVADLEATRTRWQDPAYVEQQAREKLKFVRPGERSYTVLDADPEVAPVELGDVAVSLTEGLPWYATLVDSLEVADRSTSGS